MFLSIYPKRTKLISIDSKLYMLAKRKTVFFFSPVLLLWLESFCYLCTWSPPQSDFFVFFVTILLPTISNRWAFTLIIRAILCCMYNMWQNSINSWQLWKKRKKEGKVWQCCIDLSCYWNKMECYCSIFGNIAKIC